MRVPAVYMFCRSLAVENVPSIAKGNLTQVFQDVCRSYKKLDSPNRDGNRTKSREFGRPLPELMRLVELQLLYINGTPKSYQCLPTAEYLAALLMLDSAAEFSWWV